MSDTRTNLREALAIRPNTGLPEEFLQHDVIVCAGEDAGELELAMKAVLPGAQPDVHRYRCYVGWKLPSLTVVLSGIGTGSLEPLMWELLDHGHPHNQVVQRLVMIGTAGYLADTGFGQVFVVDESYPVGCAIHLEEENLPLKPRFNGLDAVDLPRAADISTDFYYACTPQMSDARKVRMKALNPRLSEGIDRHWKPGRLISMETGQFYHFADTYGRAGTQYVALRGVANLSDRFQTQEAYSLKVLTDALGHAVKLLAAS